MNNKTLNLRASGTKLVHDIDAIRAGVSRYVGRRWDSELKGFPESDEPSTVKAHPEYVKAVQNGDLRAADEATALYCGVPFVEVKAEVSKVNAAHPYTGKF